MFLSWSCILAAVILLSPAAKGATLFQQEGAGGASSSTQTSASPPAENASASAAQNPPVASKETPGSRAPRKGTAANVKTAKRHTPVKGRKLPERPRKIVVREGGVREPSAQLVPGMTPEEASRQRQKTEEMLASAEDNLRQLDERSLNSSQQDTVGQVRNYMEGSRAALKDGDTPRAHTLALKARLLSEDLLKH